MLNQISVSLHKPLDEQWVHFHRNLPQMIVTKTGRRITPTLEYDVRGLQADKFFAMMLTFEDTTILHLKQKQDESAGKEKTSNLEKPKPVWHVHGVKNGEYWMSYPVNFHYVELTTNIETKNAFQIPLIPGHKYIPTLSIFEYTVNDHPNVENKYLKSFRIPYTEFRAVALFKNLPKRKNGMSSEQIVGSWKQSKSMTISKAIRSPAENEVEDASTQPILVPNPINLPQLVPQNVLPPQNGAPPLNMFLNQFPSPNTAQSSSSIIPPQNNGFSINNLLSNNQTTPNPLVPLPGIPPFASNSPIFPPTQTVPPLPNTLANNLFLPALLPQLLLSMANPQTLNLLLNTIAASSSNIVPSLNSNTYPIAPQNLLGSSNASMQPDLEKEQEEEDEDEEIIVVD